MRSHRAPLDAGEALTLERFSSARAPEPEATDPVARSHSRRVEALLQAARTRIDKRKAELHRDVAERREGPPGELRSAAIAQDVRLVPLAEIHDDPDFENVRSKRHEADEEKLNLLADSMRHEGLRVPITVVSARPPEVAFYIRAGFRRVRAARLLGWRSLPAVVLPHDTPRVDERWVNIVENSLRNDLTSHEVACAARLMRDQFGVSPRDFAARTGYSEPHVGNLLRCLDKLPADVLKVWEDGGPIPVDYFIKWSSLNHDEATREMCSFAGRHPRAAATTTPRWQPSPQVKEKVHPIRMATSRGVSRMQRLRTAVETCRELTARERELCLQVVDYCTGAREDVPGVYGRARSKKTGEDELELALGPNTH